MALAVTAFERQRVAFPHIPGKATPQLFIQFAPLVLVPYRAGLPPVAVFGVGFLVQATTQRVVGKADGQAVIFVTAQAVVEVPGEMALLAVRGALQQVAALVIAVLRAAIAAQYVVAQPLR